MKEKKKQKPLKEDEYLNEGDKENSSETVKRPKITTESSSSKSSEETGDGEEAGKVGVEEKVKKIILGIIERERE